MKLSFEQIKGLLRGAVRIKESDTELCPLRFTEAQQEAYRTYSNDFYTKSFSSAGVRLEFETDSRTFSMEGYCSSGSSRKFFGFDVYVNGSLVAHSLFKRDEGVTPFSFDADLGEAKSKKVTVYFPWSAQTVIKSVSLDDGASFEGTHRPLKMIAFGDSITHGYDALNPSFSYVSRLADALCADHINKGIGGEDFFPTLAELRDDYEPDIITVAYGTNDWSKKDKETFDTNSRLFYEKLSKNYPDAKIFALAPVWRGNYNTKPSKVGPFSYVAEALEKIAADLDNVTFIDCFEFIPHDEANYIADVLHPNDEGFRHYANNLYAEIKK